MQIPLTVLLAFSISNARAETRHTLTCDGVTVYTHLIRDDGVAWLSFEHRSWLLNQPKLAWGWGEVRQTGEDPWVMTAWADFWLGRTIAPSFRTWRTDEGTLVAEVEYFDTETGEVFTRTVPCVIDAPPPPTWRERCADALARLPLRR